MQLQLYTLIKIDKSALKDIKNDKVFYKKDGESGESTFNVVFIIKTAYLIEKYKYVLFQPPPPS